MSDFEKEKSKYLNLIIKVKNRLMEIEEKYDALVNKPEYPDGTPGMVSDNDHTDKLFVRLINTDIKDFPYSGTTYFSGNRVLNYRNFFPLLESILPMPVENDGTCPWKDGDEVRVEFANGEFQTDTDPIGWNWNLSSGRTILRSQLIKRAE